MILIVITRIVTFRIRIIRIHYTKRMTSPRG